MRITKRIAAALLVVASTGLSACQGIGDDDGHNVVFWVSGGNATTDLINNTLVPMFREEYAAEMPEDLEITVLSQGDYNGLYDAVSKAIPAGTTPTMAVAYPDHAASYVASNALVDINTFIDDEELTFTAEEGGGAEDFVKAFWDEGKNISGQEGLYTVPLYKSTEVMYFNRSYFHEHNLKIPTTWDELIEVARTIHDSNPEYWDKPEHYPVIWDSDSNLFITHAYQMGYDYTDPTQTANPFVFNNEGNRNFVKELKGYYDGHLFATKGSLGGQYSSSFLTTEQCIIAIGSTGGSTYNITPNFQLGIAPEPVFNTENAAYIQQGPDVCFFRLSSETELEWGWRFYRFLTSTLTNYRICSTLSYNPVRYSSYELDQYQDYVSQYAAFVDEPLATDSEGNLLHVDSNNMGLQSMVAYQTQKIVQADQLFYSPAFLGSAEARGDETTGVGNVIAGTLTYTGSDIDGQIMNLMNVAVNNALMAYTE